MPQDLLVFTCDYDDPKIDTRLLRRSCELYHIDLQTYGRGGFPGLAKAKITDAAAFLESRSEPYAMFIDGFDSFIIGSAASIMEKYQRSGNLILVSGEKNCYPDGDLATHYPIVDRSPWRYINSGGWIGERLALIQALHEMEDLVPTYGENDQLIWAIWYLHRRGRLITNIDTKCTVFQTMAGISTHELQPDGTNAVTMASPSVYHFNGRSPNRDTYYRTFTGDLAWQG